MNTSFDTMYFYWKFLGAALLVMHLISGVSAGPAIGTQQEAQQQIQEQERGTSQETPVQKRSLEEGSKEEMAILRDLILSHVVSEVQSLREKQQEEELQQQEDEPNENSEKSSNKNKRLFLPLTGRREDVPAIKRQIRYHQCYFNPISCFRRK